jgi:hypothetical protein
MTPALVDEMCRSIAPSSTASTFFLDQHKIYVDLAERSLGIGLRRCAVDYFDVACTYLRLALQKAA